MRLDAGYESGDTVSQFYDNLVAKLVVWGHDREAARRRMLRAIDETVIEGVATTLPADVAILSHPDFVAGEHSTNWVEQTPRPVGRRRPGRHPSAPAAGRGRRDGAPGAARRHRRGRRPPLPGQAVGPRPRRRGGRPGASGRAGAPGPSAPRRQRPAAGSGTVAVPMQGTIVKVLVAVGDAVEVGQTVCVLEAMKMENNVNAEKAGTVKEVRVAAGRLGRTRRRHRRHRVASGRPTQDARAVDGSRGRSGRRSGRRRARRTAATVTVPRPPVDAHLARAGRPSATHDPRPPRALASRSSGRRSWRPRRSDEAGSRSPPGPADLPTAFGAEAGSGPLVLAVCAEYDALPDVGHACGHNIIAATAVGAGLGSSRWPTSWA